MGARLVFYLFLKPISLLPYWALYRVSDLVYLVFRTVFPYRKKVIIENIMMAFPMYNETQRYALMNAFYRHIADVFVESFKNFSIRESEVHQRMVCRNPELLDEIALKGKGIVLCGGHYNNWELYALAAPAHFSGRTMAIYKKIKNPWFDQKMRQTRGRTGLELVATFEASGWMERNASQKMVSVYAIDQSPANPERGIWVSFLGLDTLCHYGAEKHARKYDHAVVYGHIEKLKRGRYALTYELLSEHPGELPEGEIIRLASRALEADIQRAPQYWLWSHRRWKHRKPETLKHQ
jgi:KDO2-lipid IV(A) lauroyltransferase